MSLMLNLEIDSNIRRKDILESLKGCGASILENTSQVITGNFPGSNMYFVFKDADIAQEVVAEQVPYPITWTVGGRMAFHCPISTYDECSQQLHQFAEDLEKLSRAYFVLSFQHESVYAIRDEKGLRFLQKF
jgi:hypothetical protein